MSSGSGRNGRSRPPGDRCCAASVDRTAPCQYGLRAIGRPRRGGPQRRRGKTMASERLLIRGGTVLTLDPDLGEVSPGEVLVEDGKIAAVGQDLDAGDAEVIEVDE